jgi:hypothetical protein
MPRISEFYGIAIYMHHRDRFPHHFHAICGGVEAEVEIESNALIAGSLPPAARRLVHAWARQHRAEPRDNWKRARTGRVLSPIAPLR